MGPMHGSGDECPAPAHSGRTMSGTTPVSVPLTHRVAHLWSRRPRWVLRLAVIAVVTGGALALVVLFGSGNGPTRPATNATTTAPTQAAYPVGTPDVAEPSGLGPSGPGALPGLTRTY